MHGQPCSHVGQILLLSKATGHEQKNRNRTLFVCAYGIYRSNSFRKHSYHNLGIQSAQTICSFPSGVEKGARGGASLAVT